MSQSDGQWLREHTGFCGQLQQEDGAVAEVMTRIQAGGSGRLSEERTLHWTVSIPRPWEGIQCE